MEGEEADIKVIWRLMPGGKKEVEGSSKIADAGLEPLKVAPPSSLHQSEENDHCKY